MHLYSVSMPIPTPLYSLALCLEEKEKERSPVLDGQHSKGNKLHDIFPPVCKKLEHSSVNQCSVESSRFVHVISVLSCTYTQ